MAAYVCHADLAASRPAAASLTRFYLWIALGGVVGLAENNTGAVPRTPHVTGALNPTLHLDLGARINRYASVYARGEAGTGGPGAVVPGSS